MNKKIKVIDLLNKIANGEKVPEKILILDDVYYLITREDNEKVYSQLKDERNWQAFIDQKLNITRCLLEDVIILDDEVEILEDKVYELSKTIKNENNFEGFEEFGEKLGKIYLDILKGFKKAFENELRKEKE